MDIFEEAKDPFGIAADSCRNLYGWVPERYKRHNFSRLVKRGLKTEEIEKVMKNGEVFFRLTTIGRKKTIRDFSIFALQKQKWDRKWRLVIFDIAEVSRKTRDLLRFKLKELGFGMLQESVWITPYDIILDFREFVKEKGIGDYVYVMEVSYLLAGNPQELANKVWKLNELNKRYQEILGEIKKLKQMYIVYNDRVKKCQVKVKMFSMEKRLKRKVDKMKRSLRERFLTLMLADPCLPKELLPGNWYGDIVKREIYRL